jgi:NADH dehydrogenase/NADH:ubiquinone oxidoreductase subunit G
MTEAFSYLPRRRTPEQWKQYAYELEVMGERPFNEPRPPHREIFDAKALRRKRPNPGETVVEFEKRIRKQSKGAAQPVSIIFTEQAQEIAAIGRTVLKPRTYFDEMLGI